MKNLLSIGQWQGFYEYGPEYGPIVEGKEAEFRLFIEEYHDGEFKGRAIDWDGFGATGQVAMVQGFIHEGLLSLTKHYPNNYVIDERGERMIEEGKQGHTVIYEGRFDKNANCFIGTWEIEMDLEHTPDKTFQAVVTGTWRMHRHH